MESSGWASRNERYLAGVAMPELRERTVAVMQELPGLDARAAHILATYPQADQVVGLISWAVQGGLIPVEFVETVAKAPNLSWRRLLAYWAGTYPQGASAKIAGEIWPYLGEAAYAVGLKAADPAVDVEMQYQAGRQLIDLFVRVGSHIMVNQIEPCGDEVEIVPIAIMGDRTLAIEFKAHRSSMGLLINRGRIAEAIRIGLLHGNYSYIATTNDFLHFAPGDQIQVLDAVEREGGYLLIAGVSQGELVEWANHLLHQGRERHGGSGGPGEGLSRK